MFTFATPLQFVTRRPLAAAKSVSSKSQRQLPRCARAAPTTREKRRQRARDAQKQQRRSADKTLVEAEFKNHQASLGDKKPRIEPLDGAQVPRRVLQCVVKIFCTHSAPNYSMPWSLERQIQSNSSGFIISGRRIITCAHSIEHHTVIMVKRRGRDVRYPARVMAVGHECDIALLTVEDPEFWDLRADEDSNAEDEAVALEPGPLPHLQDQCAVVGYPTGGENISITQGVCSRIEIQDYCYSTAELLAVQLDAAINSGNSGGPVLNSRLQCVGVAFQSVDPGEADSIGYFIPFAVVNHFLEDISRNKMYTGFPTLGFQWQKMENRSMRKALGLSSSQSGILIKSIDPSSDASRTLQSGDIVLSIDGVAVSNAGTVPFAEQPGERISLNYLVSSRFVGEEVTLIIFRNGQETIQKYRLPAMGSARLVPLVDVSSSCKNRLQYIVYGGLVFVPLTQPYLASEFGDEWTCNAPVRLLLQHLYGRKVPNGKSEVVLLAHVLNCGLNAGYENMSSYILQRFNGTAVLNLAHLSSLLDEAERDDAVRFLRFEFEGDEVCILDKAEAMESMQSVLQTYCIGQARNLESSCTQ